MRFEGEQLASEFEEAFGVSVKSLTPRQAWWLTKFAKHVRLRCRNNSAFNNYMNRNFTGLDFKEVTKHRADGSTYPGLVITDKINGASMEDVGDD